MGWPTRNMLAHNATNSATAEARENLRLTQDGNDSDHADALKTCNANKEQHEDSKTKAAMCFDLFVVLQDHEESNQRDEHI